MEKFIAQFKNSNIIKVLEVAKPKIEERTEKYIQEVLKEEERYPSEFAIEMYQLGLIYDLVSALSKYIYDSDNLTYIELFTQKGIYVMKCLVIRSCITYSIDTEIILAGGHNIQCLHYRYLVKTNLPKPEKQNSLLTKVKELIKSKNALQRLNENEKLLQRNFDNQILDINSKINLTDEEIIEKISWLNIGGKKYCWENLSEQAKEHYGSKEEFDEYLSNEIQKKVNSHRNLYSQERILFLEKELKKNLEKINIKRKNIEA